MSNIGWVELLIIVAVIAALYLVPKKLPRLVRSLSRSIRDSRKRRKEEKDEVRGSVDEVKDVAGADDLKSTVDDIRETGDVEGVLPDKSESRTTSPGAEQSEQSKKSE